MRFKTDTILSRAEHALNAVPFCVIKTDISETDERLI